jgi:hypothetical protein
MQRTLDHQCRRCGQVHDEAMQLLDAEGCWAVATIHCTCAHYWSIIHTAPANLPTLRRWIRRGCLPEEGPVLVVHGETWHAMRLEGVSPVQISVAS